MEGCLQCRVLLVCARRDAAPLTPRAPGHSLTAQTHARVRALGPRRKQAVAAAEAALTEAWQAEVGRATEEAEARVGQVEAELARVRQQLEDHARSSDHVVGMGAGEGDERGWKNGPPGGAAGEGD